MNWKCHALILCDLNPKDVIMKAIQQENPILKVLAVIEHGFEELFFHSRVATKTADPFATLAQDAHPTTEIVGIATQVEHTL